MSALPTLLVALATVWVVSCSLLAIWILAFNRRHSDELPPISRRTLHRLGTAEPTHERDHVA